MSAQEEENAKEKLLKKIERLGARAEALAKAFKILDDKPPSAEFTADEKQTIRKGLGWTYGNRVIRERKSVKETK